MTSAGDIELRAVEPADLEFLFRLENDPNNWLVSNSVQPFSRSTLSQYCNSVHDIFKDGQLRLIINHQEDAVGTIDLFEYDQIHRRAGVGIIVEQAWQGQGIGKQALVLMISYCQKVLHLHQLYCNIMKSNERSQRLFKASGFELAGVKKEWILTRDGAYEDEQFYQLMLSNG